jgi:hypothetical protein
VFETKLLFLIGFAELPEISIPFTVELVTVLFDIAFQIIHCQARSGVCSN